MGFRKYKDGPTKGWNLDAPAAALWNVGVANPQKHAPPHMG